MSTTTKDSDPARLDAVTSLPEDGLSNDVAPSRGEIGALTAHSGAGGGDEDGYDMTGVSGPTTHRDVRNWATALRPTLGKTVTATLLRYVDRQEAAEREAAAQLSLVRELREILGPPGERVVLPVALVLDRKERLLSAARELERLKSALEFLSRYKWELFDSGAEMRRYVAFQIEPDGGEANYLARAETADEAALGLASQLGWRFPEAKS